MIKYIAYSRKSTDEPDRQILSIDAQIEEIKEFAARESLEIIDFVTESKTAKQPGREKFESILTRIEKGEAQGILSWHPDRLARNSIDGGKIIYLLDTGKLLDLKFPTFWFDNTPQGKFMLNIAFGQSKYYVDNLSENVKRGNRQKLRRGEWPNQAPFGYLNVNKKIVVDRKRAPFVKKAFEMFATGTYTFVDIRDFFTENRVFNKSGHILHLDKVKRILTDPFYYGVMKFKGELYEGTHKPLISKKLFDKAQEAVRLRSRNTRKNKHNFLFNGFIRCGECGRFIVGETHTKFYKRTNRTATYVYYRCTKKNVVCKQRYLRDEGLQAQFKDFIGRVSLPPQVGEKFLKWAEKDVIKEKQKLSGSVDLLKEELKEIETKLERLLEGYLDRVIDSGEYQEKKNKLIEKKLNLNQRIKELETNGSEWLEPFQEFIDTALQAGKIARVKNNAADLRSCGETVGSNFFLTDRRLRANYKNRGWKPLAAGVAAAPAQPATSYWLRS